MWRWLTKISCINLLQSVHINIFRGNELIQIFFFGNFSNFGNYFPKKGFWGIILVKRLYFLKKNIFWNFLSQIANPWYICHKTLKSQLLRKAQLMSEITFQDVIICTACFLNWHWYFRRLSLVSRLWLQQKFYQIFKELEVLAKSDTFGMYCQRTKQQFSNIMLLITKILTEITKIFVIYYMCHNY